MASPREVEGGDEEPPTPAPKLAPFPLKGLESGEIFLVVSVGRGSGGTEEGAGSTAGAGAAGVDTAAKAAAEAEWERDEKEAASGLGVLAACKSGPAGEVVVKPAPPPPTSGLAEVQ